MDKEDCVDYVSIIDSLKSYWEFPREQVEWATLGSAMYLDGARYDDKVIRLNPLLKENFTMY